MFIWSASTGRRPALLLCITIQRGSYTSAHVLLNLLNELGKSGRLAAFHNKFDKFNNTRARMFDSTYHMTLKLL